MCPQVNSAEQAHAVGGRAALGHRPRRRAVSPRCPLRHRPGRRSRRARDTVFGIAQIESPEAVESVEEIAAVDGIDVAVRRPERPLVLDGHLPRLREPDVPQRHRARQRGRAQCRQGDRDLPHRVDQVAPALADGFRMIALGSDGGYMMAAAATRSPRRRDAVSSKVAGYEHSLLLSSMALWRLPSSRDRWGQLFAERGTSCAAAGETSRLPRDRRGGRTRSRGVRGTNPSGTTGRSLRRGDRLGRRRSRPGSGTPSRRATRSILAWTRSCVRGGGATSAGAVPRAPPPPISAPRRG